VIDTLYPVGAVYISTLSTNPATLLGRGTWSAFGAGRVPVGVDGNDSDFDTAEKTGGAKTVAATGSVAAPTFTGNSNTTSSVSGGTPVGTVSTPTFTGSQGTTSAVSGGTPAGTVSTPTFTGSALSTHTHTLTPAGTISTPTFTGSPLSGHTHTVTPTGTNSAPAFTGSASSVVQPYVAVYMWKRTA
jgi:hypothetical protein